MPGKKLRRSDIITYLDIPADELEYNPLDCFLLSNDPLMAYMSFFMATILMTVYNRAPEALRYTYSRLGIELIKMDLSDPVQLLLLFYYRRVLLSVCSFCKLRVECPWWTALRYLRIYSR